MTVDQLRIARALRDLDALAAEHPDAFRCSPAEWEALLREDDAMKHDDNVRPSGKPCAFRLEPAILKDLDRIVRATERGMPGLKVTRGDVVRILLREALSARHARDKG